MILYFTGTGNSRYVAERIAGATGDTLVCFNDRIRNGSPDPIICGADLTFVTPTYAWRIPRLVREYIRKTEFKGARSVRFVMDCGSEIGNAASYNRVLAAEKNWRYLGTAQVIMPENYIAMFKVPDKDEADRIRAKADPVIDRIAEVIRSGNPFEEPRCGIVDRIMSGPVNPLFYALFVKANAFQVSGKCIGCSQCARRCPTNNISMKENRPQWGSHCTHCMACICYCPAEAIEYGKKSIGQPRYRCEK